MLFWERVEACDHENLSPDYAVGFRCGTPYCRGDEYHCLDCGVYITKCGCGYNDGMSGWSDGRWRTYRKKRAAKRREEQRDE